MNFQFCRSFFTSLVWILSINLLKEFFFLFICVSRIFSSELKSIEFMCESSNKSHIFLTATAAVVGCFRGRR